MDWLWSPVGIGVAWLVLHGSDYLLTVAGARLFREGDLRERIVVDGSYELNPLFRAAVDRGAWLSRRFLVTLLGPAVVLPVAFAGISASAAGMGAPVFDAALEAVCGVLVFTRLSVLGGHLQNLLLFWRMLRVPEAKGVLLRYDRGTVHLIRRARWLELAAVVSVAAAATGSAFLIGGSVGVLLVLAVSGLWARADARARAAAGG